MQEGKKIIKENKKVDNKNIKPQKKHPVITAPTSFSERAADKLTSFVGSWTFIVISIIFIILWVSANIYAWISRWDPYPFILLNLFLSILAAMQAPIILMSQNRQSQGDRIRAEYDYSTNRRSERDIIEIRKQLNRIEKKLT